MMKLVRLLIFLGLTLLSQSMLAASCQSQLTDSITDYANKHLILNLLIEVQQAVLQRSLRNPKYQSQYPLFEQFREASLSAQNNTFTKSNFLANEYLADRDITLVDPRKIKLELTTQKADVIASECPRYQLLTAKDCSKDKLDIHNFFTFYLHNVRGICGKPVEWVPTQTDAPIKPFFEVLSEPNKRFLLLYEFHEQPYNGMFREDLRVPPQKNFFVAFYLDFLAESIRAKAVDFVYQEFLGPREDVIERYPTLGYLRPLLNSLMVTGGLIFLSESEFENFQNN